MWSSKELHLKVSRDRRAEQYRSPHNIAAEKLSMRRVCNCMLASTTAAAGFWVFIHEHALMAQHTLCSSM
jgi:hypothetical protein